MNALILFWNCMLNKNGNLTLSEIFIMFDCKPQFKTDPVIDLIILLAKFYTYKLKCKLQITESNLVVFKKRFWKVWTCYKLVKFTRNWLSLQGAYWELGYSMSSTINVLMLLSLFVSELVFHVHSFTIVFSVSCACFVTFVCLFVFYLISCCGFYHKLVFRSFF